MKKVIFMGTPDFAVPPLQALIDAGYEVQAVFSQPDKKRGRNGEPTPTPVKALALKHGIPVYTPAKIREGENYDILKGYAPDVIVVAAFGQIIPKSILTLPKFGCLNVHASLLPAYRGAAPIQWALLNGEKVSGVTIMQMGEGLDTGDMLSAAEVEISEDETGGSLFDKLSAAGAKLLVSTLKELEDGKITPVPQPEKSTTDYASMIDKSMGKIDWERSAVSIERLIRAMNPWPSAYTYIGGKQLKIWKASVEEASEKEAGKSADEGGVCGCAGCVVKVTKESISVKTGDGLLILREIQLEGKKRLDAASFLRGYELREGMRLG